MAQYPLPGQGWKDTRGNSCPLPGAGVWPVCEHLGPLGGQWGPPVVHRLSAFLSGSQFPYLSKGAPVDWGWEAWDGTYSVTHLDLGAAHKVFLFGGPRQGRGVLSPHPRLSCVHGCASCPLGKPSAALSRRASPLLLCQ